MFVFFIGLFLAAFQVACDGAPGGSFPAFPAEIRFDRLGKYQAEKRQVSPPPTPLLPVCTPEQLNEFPSCAGYKAFGWCDITDNMLIVALMTNCFFTCGNCRAPPTTQPPTTAPPVCIADNSASCAGYKRLGLCDLPDISSWFFHYMVQNCNATCGECEPPATMAPTTGRPATTTMAPPTELPTTKAPPTEPPITMAPPSEAPTIEHPTTVASATAAPTTMAPPIEPSTTMAPQTAPPTTMAPPNESPTTMPTLSAPLTTRALPSAPPTSRALPSAPPTTMAPPSESLTTMPTPSTTPMTRAPPTAPPTTMPIPSAPPTTRALPSAPLTTRAPPSAFPSTMALPSAPPTTMAPSNESTTTMPTPSAPPTTRAPPSAPPTTMAPPSETLMTSGPTTATPQAPTTMAPTTKHPTTMATPTAPSTTMAPPTEPPSSMAPPTEPPSTMAPPTLTPEDACLQAHNAKRALHGSSPLAWNDVLAQHAQAWADHLAATETFVHEQGTGEGENLYWAEASTARNCSDAVESWYSEELLYNYNRPPQTLQDFLESDIGHFTQVVWKGTTMLGAGIATVGGGNTSIQTYIVARYSPPGNILGRFPENVIRPVV